MTRSPNGLHTKDPFFERMMDERIATLRAFLRMTSEKYQCPEPPTTSPATDDEERATPAGSNVIKLRQNR